MADAEDQSQKYDQAFFLTLAAKGKDAWNEWRRDPANKDVRVTFAGIDFSQAPRDEINFEGFKFGDRADFSWCTWPGGGGAILEGFMPGLARFSGAAFGHFANFSNTFFGAFATFADASFGHFAKFTGAAFGDYAIFVGAAFGSAADFTGVAFGGVATFAGASFGDSANFTGAAFGHGTLFNQTYFKGRVTFTGKSKEQWTEDFASVYPTRTEATAALGNRHNESWKRIGSGPDRFLAISFARAHFDGEANFSGRTFEQAADFTNARFYYPPDFDPETKHARADFTGAYIGFVRPGHFHWTSETKVRFNCAVFENSPKIGRATISNATSISRNAKPNVASICVCGSKT